MKPSDKDVQAEIEWLEKNKPSVRRTSMFGDDHHAAIDAQLEVLKERLSFYDCADRGNFEGDDQQEDKWPPNAREAAARAVNWLEGDEDISPSKNWEGLLVKEAK